jgi:hypothetical protein
MMNSSKLTRVAAIALLTASAISVTGCATSGAAPRQAHNNTDMIDYCVKRGTHMECRQESASAYADEREMYNERLEMREEDYE